MRRAVVVSVVWASLVVYLHRETSTNINDAGHLRAHDGTHPLSHPRRRDLLPLLVRSVPPRLSHRRIVLSPLLRQPDGFRPELQGVVVQGPGVDHERVLDV